MSYQTSVKDFFFNGNNAGNFDVDFCDAEAGNNAVLVVGRFDGGGSYVTSRIYGCRNASLDVILHNHIRYLCPN